MKRPEKIANTSKDFFSLIKEKIKSGQYFITNHAQQRATERGIAIKDILSILLGNPGYTQAWIKSKDEFKQAFIDEPSSWFYRIEGTTPDQEYIRIIVAFDDEQMPIITVIKL